MVTVAKSCAGLAWCINPCQIVYERRDTALRFLRPPGADATRHPPPPGTPPPDRATAVPKRAIDDDPGGRLWAGRVPKHAPAWAAFVPGSKHKGLQSAVAYATKTGHLIQVGVWLGPEALAGRHGQSPLGRGDEL